MKLNRWDPHDLTKNSWLYVNEGSITVVMTGAHDKMVRISRSCLLAALKAMRQRTLRCHSFEDAHPQYVSSADPKP
jgi:hypothetical protein